MVPVVLAKKLKKNSNKDFIEFRNGFGCYSLAGRDGGKQGIVLSSHCAEEHTLIHEVYFANYVEFF